MREDDIVKRAVDLIRQHDESFATRHGPEIERRLRTEFGGDEPYVPKQPRHTERDQAIVEERSRGADTGTIARKFRLSRRQVQRVLRR